MGVLYIAGNRFSESIALWIFIQGLLNIIIKTRKYSGKILKNNSIILFRTNQNMRHTKKYYNVIFNAGTSAQTNIYEEFIPLNKVYKNEKYSNAFL